MDPHMQYVSTGIKSVLIDGSNCLEDMLANVSTYKPKPSKKILPTGTFLKLLNSPMG